MQLMDRNIKPIAHKRLVPQKESQEHIAQNLPLITTLPTEILDEILGIVLKDGILESIKQESPILGLRQYRTLIVTCKLFKTIIDKACLKLMMQCVDVARQPGIFTLPTTRILVSPWDDFTIADAQMRSDRSCCRITSIKRWNAVFKSFQLLSVRQISCSSFQTIEVGRFWRNPYLRLDDCPALDTYHLLRLRPVFERTKRPPTNVERQGIRSRKPSSFSHGEIVNVITGRNKIITAYSVHTWKSRNISMSNLSVSVRAEEWWIVKVNYYYRSIICIVGYYDNRSLVIDANNWKTYQAVLWKKPAWR